MRVTVIQCGPMANESERKAVEHLKARLVSEPGDGEWVLLANLAFSVTHRMQSDEIDIIAIGPPGVRVIEVKHWNVEWLNERGYDLEREADLVTGKARKVGTTLRKELRELPRVDGAFLLTQEPAKIKRLVRQTIRGIPFYGLAEWKDALDVGGSVALSPSDVKRLSRALEPRSPLVLEGSLRRFAGYVNLELQSPRTERFHRIYHGSHPTRRDRAILHLYDSSAIDDKNAETKARREFDALHRLQLYAWAPRILDSFQEAPGYPGEMSFFTIVDPAAPPIADRSSDETWTARDRIEFARNAVQALSELHRTQRSGDQLVHRNLTPQTLLVKHDNSPILTGFDRARISTESSIGSGDRSSEHTPGVVAPEVVAGGLSSADVRSDVFSLCASLLSILDDGDEQGEKAVCILSAGTAERPDERPTLDDLHRDLSKLLGISQPRLAAPPARFWTEGQLVTFRDHNYRIINRLGSGGIGTVFKVVAVDRSGGEDLGTYVAKVLRDEGVGKRTLRAYSLARSHLGRHAGLSAIFEVAKEWKENSFVSLMTWIEGTPLAEFIGVFSLLADDLQEASSGDLALRWIRWVCGALGVLHRNGLVHGDVSPRNLIVSGNDLVLTDFDFVGKVGEESPGSGTVTYCAPSSGAVRTCAAGDDIYALAASVFHVVYEREPFKQAGRYEKERGLNWEGLDQQQFPLLNAFLNRATDPVPGRRFESVEEVEAFLKQQAASPAIPPTNLVVTPVAEPVPALALPSNELAERSVEWLKDVLRSYPGSPEGNQETRGLDSSFATSTYVETALERTLTRDMKARTVRLVVLCGNAGDGKTALLQHIARTLGLGHHASADRILQGTLSDGLMVRMNLDGSAAWKGRSADELLDEFLRPFQQGEPADDAVHLLAINDGRLLEWVEGYEARHGAESTPLTESLLELLQNGASQTSGHIRFITLNQRTLVGDVAESAGAITTEFLDRLLDQLYGANDTAKIWNPCSTCSSQARCEVFRAAQLFAPEGFPRKAPEEARHRARERLAEALQAVHLRGEIHITVRELRAALVYILFGIQYCDSYHSGVETPAYWNRAFDAEAPARQGEVLRELVRFDPALEAHPHIDRHLTSEPIADIPPAAPHYPTLPLADSRRRAFFEWTRDQVAQVAGGQDELDLARGRHIRKFRDLPLYDDTIHGRICRDLCRGISRLEDLPPAALDREGAVPLRVTPRTPTETAFWVEKPVSAFRLAAVLPPRTEGLERLHRQAALIYRYRDGREEVLRLGADLFHLLLELADGYQLGDVSTDDAFANLSIFVQRLVQEDARELLAWNPMADDIIYEVTTQNRDIGGERRQCLTIASRNYGAQ